MMNYFNQLIKIILISMLCLFLIPPVLAARHALLIGVSEYPNLEQGRWLIGPTNDVDLMQQVLLKRGFEQENFRILADNLDGALEPTYANIVSELETLVERVEPGDFVYIHFSGHGSQQNDPDDDLDEERDGMDEIFLTKDVTAWPESDGLIKNVLVDDQIDQFVKQLTNKDVKSWWVFDSCQSSTMLRGQPSQGIRDRSVPPDILGVELPAIISSTRGSSDTDNPLDNKTDADFIALYGAESNQFAFELELPLNGPSKRQHGFLTYNLAQILTAAQPGITYRQIGQQLLQNYASLNISSTNPVMEGPMYDDAVLNETKGDLVQQWRVTQTASDHWIRAGRLHGIRLKTKFAIMENSISPDEESLARAIVVEQDAFNSRLELDANSNGSNTIDLGGKFARLLEKEPRLNLTVSKPVLPDNLLTSQQVALQIIDKLEQEPFGVDITWLPSTDIGDVSLRMKDDELLFLDPGASLVDRPISIHLDDEDENLTEKIQHTLRTIAKGQNLFRLVANFQSGTFTPLIESTLTFKRDDRASEFVDVSKIADLVDGDKLMLTVVNPEHGIGAIDLTILFLDSRYGIQTVFPANQETGRLQPGDKIIRQNLTVNASTSTGIEYFLIIALKADPTAQPSDFTFLTQDTLPSVTRSRGGEDQTVSSLNQLITRAAFGDQTQTRGLHIDVPQAKYLNMELIQIRVNPGE